MLRGDYPRARQESQGRNILQNAVSNGVEDLTIPERAKT